jgi:hypothetical protein
MPTIDNAFPDEKGLRNFALVTSAMIAGIFGLLLPFVWEFQFPVWPWVVAAVLTTWGLIHPASLRYVYMGWMKFAHILGWVNTRILLGIVFFAIVWPMGLVLRLFRRDPMARELTPDASSYRVQSKQPVNDKLERPF